MGSIRREDEPDPVPGLSDHVRAVVERAKEAAQDVLDALRSTALGAWCQDAEARALSEMRREVLAMARWGESCAEDLREPGV